MDYDSDLTDLEDELEPGPPQKKEGGRQPGEYRLPHSLRPPRTTTYSAESLHRNMTDNDIELEPEYVTIPLEGRLCLLINPVPGISAKLSGRKRSKSN